MKWKGTTEEDTGFTDTVLDDAYDEDEYPVWEKRKGSSFSDSFIGKMRMPLVVTVIGLIVFSAVYFVSTRGNGEKIDIARIEAVEKRLATLEERLFRIEGAGGQTEGATQQISSLQDKVLQIETDIASRMDQFSSELSRFRKKASAAAPPVRKKRTETGATPLYHRVRAGDTLFGIGRKYGVSVAELLKLNHLSSRKVIHPGQKLIVGSSKGQ